MIKPRNVNGRFRNFLNKNFFKIISLNALFKNAFLNNAIIKTLKISNTRIKLLKGNSKMALLEEFISEFFVPSLECSGFLLFCLKVSKKETPQQLLCQCSVTHTAQKCFLIFRGNFLCSSLCPLPLVLELSMAALCSLFAHFLQVFIDIDLIIHQYILFQTMHFQISVSPSKRQSPVL